MKTKIEANSRIAARAIILIILILALGTPAAVAGGSAASARELLKRIEQLEQANTALAGQNRAIQRQLSQQSAEISALSQQLQASARPLHDLQQQIPDVSRQVAALEKKQREVPVTIGFRAGWAESPYDMPGGAFYSAFLNERLLTEEDGIPFGYISGELMAGVILGGTAPTTGNLASSLIPKLGPVNSWMNTVEIEPTLQYHPDLGAIGFPSLKALRPYVLAGPGMWISLMSTPVVNGNVPGSGFRHYDADFQPGGVYGLGFTWLLGDSLYVPAIQHVLSRTSLGAEWRYNAMTNGEQFQQYTGSLGIGW